MAVSDSNIVEYYQAICWDLPIIASCTRYDTDVSPCVISKNQYSHGTISRKDLWSHTGLSNIGILRDFTPESRQYLAGLIAQSAYSAATSNQCSAALC
jgi:hypothetical protein